VATLAGVGVFVTTTGVTTHQCGGKGVAVPLTSAGWVAATIVFAAATKLVGVAVAVTTVMIAVTR
jgi:hypothetical protein